MNHTKTITALFCLLLGLIELSGCASHEPARHFTLEPIKSMSEPGPGPSIGLRPVEIPEYLRRSAIVRETDHHELQLNTQERWAEPLEDGIRRVMALNLAALLPTKDVRQYPWTAPRRPEVVISLQFLELEASQDSARLVVEVEVARSQAQTNSQLVMLQTPLMTEASGSQIATAFSQLMRQLAAAVVPMIKTTGDPA